MWVIPSRRPAPFERAAGYRLRGDRPGSKGDYCFTFHAVIQSPSTSMGTLKRVHNSIDERGLCLVHNHATAPALAVST
jgi:hypothetical protein